MKIAILSDVHDHLEHLRHGLERVQGCGALLFCGDLCAPFTLAEILARFPGPVHVVLGNNDGDALLIAGIARRSGRATLYGIYADLELAGRRIAVVHYPRLAEGLAALGDYDLVCHGHDHQRRLEQVGRSTLLNPGEVMGWKGPSSCALYDTGTGQVEFVEWT